MFRESNPIRNMSRIIPYTATAIKNISIEKYSINNKYFSTSIKRADVDLQF